MILQSLENLIPFHISQVNIIYQFLKNGLKESYNNKWGHENLFMWIEAYYYMKL